MSQVTESRASSAAPPNIQDVFLNSEWQSSVRTTYTVPVVEVDLGGSLQLRQGYPSPFFHRANTAFDTSTDVLIVRPARGIRPTRSGARGSSRSCRGTPWPSAAGRATTRPPTRRSRSTSSTWRRAR